MSAPKRCPTEKRRFETYGQAQAALRKTKNDLTRLYQVNGVAPPCRKCGGYHLTSKSSKPRRSGKARR